MRSTSFSSRNLLDFIFLSFAGNGHVCYGYRVCIVHLRMSIVHSGDHIEEWINQFTL